MATETAARSTTFTRPGGADLAAMPAAAMTDRRAGNCERLKRHLRSQR